MGDTGPTETDALPDGETDDSLPGECAAAPDQPAAEEAPAAAEPNAGDIAPAQTVEPNAADAAPTGAETAAAGEAEDGGVTGKAMGVIIRTKSGKAAARTAAKAYSKAHAPIVPSKPGKEAYAKTQGRKFPLFAPGMAP